MDDLLHALKVVHRHIEYSMCWPEDYWSIGYFNGCHKHRNQLLEQLKEYRR